MSSFTNPPSVIDEGAFTVRRTIRIAAPIEKVWSAVTEPAHISRWFGQARFEGSTPGSLGTLSWDDREPIPIRIEAIDAPRMVAYRWANDDASGIVPDAIDDDHSTVFTFTLEPVANGTQLTVVETGFDTTSDPAENLASHAQGWISELDELVAVLESDS